VNLQRSAKRKPREGKAANEAAPELFDLMFL
jgi:hypothetical protein